MFKRSLLLAAVLVASWSSVAHASSPRVPDAIKVPAGHRLSLQSHATGVQIYACGASGWTFVAPRADLYGPFGLLRIGTHFAGPTWRSFGGSQVVGKAVANAPVDAGAIPWLLISAVSTTPGLFGDTAYIQRVNTTGGLAPAPASCTTPGTQAEVPYTADYRFYR